MRLPQTLKGINIIKTIYFNLRYFDLKTAFKFPVLVSHHVRLRHTGGRIILEKPAFGCIKLGFDSISIFDNQKSRSIWDVSDNGTIIFKGNAGFGHGFKLSIGGKCIIGNGFAMTAESSIVCAKEIEFGSNTLLSWDILIMDTDFHSILNDNHEITNKPSKISIGDNVWIGCRATILKGTNIPNGSVIAAGSIVSKSLESDNAIYGGYPVHLIKDNIAWKP